MASQATGTFEKKTWDEKPYEEPETGAKLARASIVNGFAGDIEGESTLEYLLAYPSDTFASFVGLERVVGRLAGRAGSFVLQHSGTFDAGGVRADWFVVPDSGTDELQGLRGSGGYVWDGSHGDACGYTLDYEIE